MLHTRAKKDGHNMNSIINLQTTRALEIHTRSYMCGRQCKKKLSFFPRFYLCAGRVASRAFDAVTNKLAVNINLTHDFRSTLNTHTQYEWLLGCDDLCENIRIITRLSGRHRCMYGQVIFAHSTRHHRRPSTYSSSFSLPTNCSILLRRLSIWRSTVWLWP